MKIAGYQIIICAVIMKIYVTMKQLSLHKAFEALPLHYTYKLMNLEGHERPITTFFVVNKVIIYEYYNGL